MSVAGIFNKTFNKTEQNTKPLNNKLQTAHCKLQKNKEQKMML